VIVVYVVNGTDNGPAEELEPPRRALPHPERTRFEMKPLGRNPRRRGPVDPSEYPRRVSLADLAAGFEPRDGDNVEQADGLWLVWTRESVERHRRRAA
jgi:hypothetical protein